jgi:two-component system OmpR family sensor kinase/two-component system sensor histidine kinase QseC
VRHSPRGSRVELRVFADAGVPTLQVDDAGPGIPPEERGRVFDRFYRRVGDDELGSGLGLAIVRSVADRHGASVSLDRSALGGLRVRVHFAKPSGKHGMPWAAGLPTLSAAAPVGAAAFQDTTH